VLESLPVCHAAVLSTIVTPRISAPTRRTAGRLLIILLTLVKRDGGASKGIVSVNIDLTLLVP
jgi:hypothetical protein